MQLLGANARDRAEELGGRPQRREECSEGTRRVPTRQVINEGRVRYSLIGMSCPPRVNPRRTV